MLIKTLIVEIIIIPMKYILFISNSLKNKNKIKNIRNPINTSGYIYFNIGTNAGILKRSKIAINAIGE